MRYYLLLTAISLHLLVHAQTMPHCGTDEWLQQQMRKDPGLAQRMADERSALHAFIEAESGNRGNGGVILTIPVVFHVIHQGQSAGSGTNISDAQIFSQMQVLNECYRKRNADTVLVPAWFEDRVADLEIEFCLATTDPGGNSTSGIVRHQYSNLSNFDQNIKPITQWDPTRYLNIWTSNLGGNILGYATMWGVGPANEDGVVIDYRQVGRTPANPFIGAFNLGKTAVHEIGHWLGMFHTFQDSCRGTTAATCSLEGDYICDTPPTREANYGSPSLTQNTCTESPVDEYDMWMNYMDYVNDVGLLMFTPEQKEVMRATLLTKRLPILSSLGCSQSFTAFQYAGRVVDEATNAGLENARVLFDGAQDYEVITDAFGNFTVNNMLEGYYDVYAGKWGYRTTFFLNHEQFIGTSPQITIPLRGNHYYDDFIMNFGWSVSSNCSSGQFVRDIPLGTFNQGEPAGPQLDVIDDFGFKAFVTGNGSTLPNADDVDNGSTTVISPAFDLTGFSDPYVRYSRWFYNAPINNNTADDYMSIKLNNGSSNVTLENIMATDNQWVSRTFRVGDFLQATNNMRLIVDVYDLAAGNPNITEGAFDKFEVLDGDAVGLTEINPELRLTVTPNPASTVLNFYFDSNINEPIQLRFYNLLGATLKHHESAPAQMLSLNTEGLPPGVYMVQVKSGSAQRTVKVIIAH